MPMSTRDKVVGGVAAVAALTAVTVAVAIGSMQWWLAVVLVVLTLVLPSVLIWRRERADQIRQNRGA